MLGLASGSRCRAMQRATSCARKRRPPRGRPFQCGASETRPGLQSRKGGCETKLFRCLLARRIECAGIVDLGHLMVAEAQHLTQDFVGVFAK
jgi:hypothetical protein